MKRKSLASTDHVTIHLNKLLSHVDPCKPVINSGTGHLLTSTVVQLLQGIDQTYFVQSLTGLLTKAEIISHHCLQVLFLANYLCVLCVIHISKVPSSWASTKAKSWLQLSQTGIELSFDCHLMLRTDWTHICGIFRACAGVVGAEVISSFTSTKVDAWWRVTFCCLQESSQNVL